MADWTHDRISGNVTSSASVTGSIQARFPITGNVSGGSKMIRELRFLPFFEFPPIGREEVLYIATDTDQTYYWDGYMYRTLSLPNYEIVAKTTAEWAQLPNYISKAGSIYIYTDYTHDEEDRDVPAMKIGDGNAYVIDLPFMSGGSIVTEEEKERWNNKVSAAISPFDNEKLVLYTDDETLLIGG